MSTEGTKSGSFPLVVSDDGKTMKDCKGRVVVAVKANGLVLSRYPDMTAEEKGAIVSIWSLIQSSEGDTVDFMGQPLTGDSLMEYLDFKDKEVKGDLCG